MPYSLNQSRVVFRDSQAYFSRARWRWQQCAQPELVQVAAPNSNNCVACSVDVPLKMIRHAALVSSRRRPAGYGSGGDSTASSCVAEERFSASRAR